MSTITAAQVAQMPIPKLKQHAVNLGVKTDGLSPDALKKAVIAALNKPAAAATGKKTPTAAPAAGKKGSAPAPAAKPAAPAAGKKLAPMKPGAAAPTTTPTKAGASVEALEALSAKVAYLFAVLGLDANEHPEDPAEGSSLAVVHLGQSMPEEEGGEEEEAEGEPAAEDDILAEWRTEDGQLGLTAEIVNGMNMAQLDALAAELELDFGNAKVVPLKRKAVIAYLESLDEGGGEEQTIIEGPGGEKAIEWAQDIEGFDGGEAVWISREHTDPKKKGAVTKSWHAATVSADPYGADEAGDRYLQVELNDNGEVLYIFAKGVGEAEMVGLVPQE